LAKLRERWNLIQDPIHTISYFFDPRFRQQMISEQLRRNVTTVIKKLVSSDQSNWIEKEFAKFRNKEYPYDEVVPADSDPIIYWKNLATTVEGSKLSRVVLNILQFPQSSASVERSFSALRRVHTWQRASLGREKLSKMIYVYVNCATLRKIVNK